MFLILFLSDNRVIAKSVAEGFMAEKALVFQDADHGGDGIIMGLGVRQFSDDLFNECFAEMPASLHDLLFPFG
jgi:hypothetical protein